MSIIDLTWTRIAHLNLNLAGGSVVTRGLSGRPQVVAVENRYWTGQVDFPAMTEVQALHMRAAGDRLAGVANAFRLAVPNGGEGFAARLLERSVADVDRWLSFGVANGPDIDAAVAGFDPVTVGAAVAGASSLAVARADLLQVGRFFSVGDRLHRVAAVGAGVVEFNPPLRAAVPDATRLRVVRPTVALRLAAPDGWKVFQDYARLGRPMTVQVEEAFDA